MIRTEIVDLTSLISHGKVVDKTLSKDKLGCCSQLGQRADLQLCMQTIFEHLREITDRKI
jgi:hypothetical protein